MGFGEEGAEWRQKLCAACWVGAHACVCSRVCMRVCVDGAQDLLGNGFVGRLNSWSVSFLDNSLSLGPVSRVQPSAIGPYAARSSFVFAEHASYVHLDAEAAEVRVYFAAV